MNLNELTIKIQELGLNEELLRISKRKLTNDKKQQLILDLIKSKEPSNKPIAKTSKQLYHNNYYQRNKNKYSTYYKQYRIRNKKKLNEYSKNYYRNNKEQIKAYLKQYRIRNKQKLNEYNRNYYQNNKEYFRNYKQTKLTSTK